MAFWQRAAKFSCVNSEPALWRCGDCKPLPHGFTQPKEEGGSFDDASASLMLQPPPQGRCPRGTPLHSPACGSGGAGGRWLVQGQEAGMLWGERLATG